ncbi:MAG TPA: hypothetical protein VLG91_17240 [Streptomyces sp.]|nr:hypothetical protein [Streptomyces sp.]
MHRADGLTQAQCHRRRRSGQTRCDGLAHTGANASEETTGEFFEGAIALIDAAIQRPAFFLARQLAEPSSKSLLEPGIAVPQEGR